MMNEQGLFKTIEYDQKYALETAQMWRASMESALGIKDPHRWEEQLAYLKAVVDKNRVFLVLEKSTDHVLEHGCWGN
jgi:hypothetical protein